MMPEKKLQQNKSRRGRRRVAPSKRSSAYCITVPVALMQRLDDRAFEQGRKRSALILEAVSAYLDGGKIEK